MEAMIYLTNGEAVRVDAEDVERLAARTWYKQNRGYAVSHQKKNGHITRVLMHRFIVGAQPNERWDHINGDRLDNRKANLRLASSSQNSANSKVREGRKYKGVCYVASRDQYFAYATKEGKQHSLGYWDTAEAAARAYDQAVRNLFGEYARPNFPHLTSPSGMPETKQRRKGYAPRTFRDAASKECAICHEVKPRSEFQAVAARLGGDPHETRCRDCNVARLKQYRKLIERTCRNPNCGGRFLAAAAETRPNHGRFCSRHCARSMPHKS